MSKHMRRQARAQPKEAPPFEPPIVVLDPCLQMVSYGLKPFVRPLLGLWCPDLHKYLGQVEFLDTGFYAVRNLPDSFPPAHPIHQYSGHIPIENETFTNKEALARQHYLKDYCASFIMIRPYMTQQLPIEWFHVAPQNPLCSVKGDKMSVSGFHSVRGTWNATMETLSFPPLPFTFAVDHNHPNMSIFAFYPGDQQHTAAAVCHHWPEGVHTLVKNNAIVISFT